MLSVRVAQRPRTSSSTSSGLPIMRDHAGMAGQATFDAVIRAALGGPAG